MIKKYSPKSCVNSYDSYIALERFEIAMAVRVLYRDFGASEVWVDMQRYAALT